LHREAIDDYYAIDIIITPHYFTADYDTITPLRYDIDEYFITLLIATLLFRQPAFTLRARLQLLTY